MNNYLIYEFQFHKVRLKDVLLQQVRVKSSFQFHKVRLKGSFPIKKRNFNGISIP